MYNFCHQNENSYISHSVYTVFELLKVSTLLIIQTQELYKEIKTRNNHTDI